MLTDLTDPTLLKLYDPIRMKKAYIVMAHKNPLQLHRLILRLDDGTSMFFVHIDATVDILPFESINAFGDILQFVERVNSKWGSFGSVQASLNGLKAVRNTQIPFKQIFLISGQDYPIKSNAYLDQFVENAEQSNFFDYFPIPNYEKWPGNDRGGLYRVDKYYIGLKKHELFLSRVMNFLSSYIPLIRRRIPNGMLPYAGSQWWSIDIQMVNYILDYDAKHPEYRAFHRFTFVPDEVYVQMIVANSTDQNRMQTTANNNKRFMIWEDTKSAHPNTLRTTDFDAILASDYLFARKFDETVDTEILDLIDQEILLKDLAEFVK